MPVLAIRRYLTFRLSEAVFLAFLPLFAKAEPHLFYSRSTCLGFACFLTGHTAILLLAQAFVSLRQHIQTEGMSAQPFFVASPMPSLDDMSVFSFSFVSCRGALASLGPTAAPPRCATTDAGTLGSLALR